MCHAVMEGLSDGGHKLEWHDRREYLEIYLLRRYEQG
jgi:hypothetical protein